MGSNAKLQPAMTCQFLNSGVCEIASDLAQLEVSPDARACEVCTETTPPRAVNTVTLNIAIYYCKNQIVKDLLIVQRYGNRKSVLKVIEEGIGPGSQLWKLFSRLGIQHSPDCSCVLLAETMNDLGPAGCREKSEHLLKLMRKNQEKYGWSTYLRAGANAVLLGWVFKLNPLDPLPGLLNKAIDLAEQQCQSHGATV